MTKRYCEYDKCKDPLPDNARRSQRFCNAPGKTCRQKHQREQRLPGTVKGLRQLANGYWSVTIHVPTQPECKMKSKVRIETDTSSRPAPSNHTNTTNDNY